MDPRIIEVPYSYDAATGFGTMAGDNIPIMVRPEANINRLRIRQLHHKNFMPSEIDDGHEGIGLHFEYGISFNQYISTQPFVFTFNIPVKDPGVQGIAQEFVTNEFRGFCRGIIKFFIEMHTHQLSLGSLDLSDFYVINGKLIARITNFAEESTDDSKASDFKMLAEVFEVAFALAGKAVPYDFGHLLLCMRNYDHGRGDYNLLKYHLAVLKTHKRVEMISGFFEKRRKMPTPHYDSIVYGVDSTDWTMLFRFWVNPSLGVANDCYAHTNPKNGSRSVYYLPRHQMNPYFWSLTALRFARDMVTHIPDHMSMYNAGPRIYTETELELTTMTIFMAQLLTFQLQAHVMGWLRIFTED